ncbi:hypothetical protein ABPG75_010135 [Micractinium tetrahymenae]
MSSLQQRRPRADTGYVHPEVEPVEEDDDDHMDSRGIRGKQGAAHTAVPPDGGHRSSRQKPGMLKAEAAALLAGLLIVAGVVYYSKSTAAASQSGLLTAEQLAAFDGRGGRRLYLAILGEVYDVTPGMRHYGPKGGYGIFAARDASRSFVTGKFKDDLHDDVADFTQEQLQELVRWRDFYAKHKEYKLVGKVVGRFYDAAGSPTPLQQRAEAAAAAAAAQEAAAKEQGQGGGAADAAVPCNVKWSRAEGGWVWCPEGQFPRRVLQADWQGGQQQERCACLDSADVLAAARLYDGCAPEAQRCQTSPPEAEAAAAAAAATA